MSATEKYRLLKNHLRLIRRMTRAGVRSDHPDWGDEEIERETSRRWLNGRT